MAVSVEHVNEAGIRTTLREPTFNTLSCGDGVTVSTCGCTRFIETADGVTVEKVNTVEGPYMSTGEMTTTEK